MQSISNYSHVFTYHKNQLNNWKLYSFFSPVQAAFIEVDGKEWTYQEVEDYSNQVANFLYKEGYREGDAIALVMLNRPEYVCIWLGMAKIGVMPALINTNLRLKSLEHCINIVNSKAVIFDGELSEGQYKGSKSFFLNQF